MQTISPSRVFTAHQQYMAEHGGVIVNIIADMFRGFPMMAHTGEFRGWKEVKVTSPLRSGQSRGREFDKVFGG